MALNAIVLQEFEKILNDELNTLRVQMDEIHRVEIQKQAQEHTRAMFELEVRHEAAIKKLSNQIAGNATKDKCKKKSQKAQSSSLDNALAKIKAFESREEALTERLKDAKKELSLGTKRLEAQCRKVADFQKTQHEAEQVIDALRLEIQKKVALVDVGIHISLRRRELARGKKLDIDRGNLRGPPIRLGNEAAHKPNPVADISLFDLGVLAGEKHRKWFEDIHGQSPESFRESHRTNHATQEAWSEEPRGRT